MASRTRSSSRTPGRCRRRTCVISMCLVAVHRRLERDKGAERSGVTHPLARHR